MRSCVAFALALVACSDPAVFRPAKSAREYPAVKDAFRVRHAPDGCDIIGVIHADGNTDPIDDIAKTAAKHGGTHYVIATDRDRPETTTTTTGVVTRGVVVASSNAQTERNRLVLADVYRCDR
jgi:hypothetical protein